MQVGPKQFDRVLDMVSKVRSLGMEVCTTLGMLNADQAQKLKEAGLSCYNHNLDTSPEYYPKITSSRNYDDRLDTLEKVKSQFSRKIGVAHGFEHHVFVGMILTLMCTPCCQDVRSLACVNFPGYKACT